MSWLNLLEYLISAAGLTGLLAFLGRFLMTQLLAKDLQKFQSELRRQHDVEIERLRADLKAVSFEHETAFASLHERRAKILSRLYALLARADSAFNILTSPVQFSNTPEDQERRMNDAWNSSKSLRRYYNENKLYLDESLCKLIDDFENKLWQAWGDFTIPDMGDNLPERRRILFSAWKTISEKLPPVRTSIEKVMRGLLKIEVPPSRTENVGEPRG